MRRVFLSSTFLVVLAFLPGCVFPTVARRWNERVDADGEPVYFVSVSKVGCNLLVLIPFLGDLSVDGLIEDLTKYLKEKDGNAIRIVQANSENYWYGATPVTWFISPVVATVAAEYRPSIEERLKHKELKEKGPTEWLWYKPWTW